MATKGMKDLKTKKAPVRKLSDSEASGIKGGLLSKGGSSKPSATLPPKTGKV